MPTAARRSLRAKPPRRVAVMVNLNWPLAHHHQVFAGIQRYAAECGNWECTLHPFAELLLADGNPLRSLDGIVARATPRLARLARAAGVPVVNVWLNSPVRNLPSVLHDAEESGRIAARHLLGRGFRNFGFLGRVDDRSSQRQRDGFCHELGVSDCTTMLASATFSDVEKQWKRFERELGRWIDGWSLPIGIFATHDLLCRYLAEACRERGIEIPSTAALVSTNNEAAVCSYPEPSLSSVDLGFERIGHRAAALLDQLMNGAAPPDAPILSPPAGLIARRSSDSFVVDDPAASAALRFIAARLHEDIHVEDVAAHVFTTRRTLARWFQKTLGMTVHECIAGMRIDRVKQRLLDPETTIKAVAAECGFRDLTHLGRAFQRLEGQSPSEYRATRTAGRASGALAGRARQRTGRPRSGP